jgi:hypothetical protein
MYRFDFVKDLKESVVDRFRGTRENGNLFLWDSKCLLKGGEDCMFRCDLMASGLQEVCVCQRS